MSNKVTILATSYYPETCAPAKRLHTLARTLVARGMEVRVVAPLPNYPQGKVYEGYQRRFVQRFEEDGVQVYRLMPFIVPKHRILLRLLAELLYAMFTVIVGLGLGRSRLVFASTPGMFMGPAGWLVARLTGAKFAWDVRDLIWRYTQAIGETGPKKWAGDCLEALMIRTARGAHLLTATTERQVQYFLEHGVDPALAQVLPNGIAEDFFQALQADVSPEGRDDQGFRVVYAGLIGYPQGLGTLIGAARTLEDEGVERGDLMQRCQEEGIQNVRFVGYLSQGELIELYRSSDILYAQLRGEPVFASAQPSKVWEYMAAGKPVIYGGSGEAVEAVERSGAGITIAPDDPEALAGAVRALRGDPQRCRSLGQAGHRFVEANLIRERLMGEVAQRLGAFVSEAPTMVEQAG